MMVMLKHKLKKGDVYGAAIRSPCVKTMLAALFLFFTFFSS
ncbi:hypothetical protein, unlikely [Trypanosoma brucei brucei TREU927]|uniref:Uncharacterized protein n=2 Tax=Trypanosoma brucei TaxID=5691 RepID=Q38DK2_TRYB2|nr:hypothetical protein, unlikely [Trypanosoma brucei brucei TREU927]EAN77118.1 hypothetical protein, unlikely [Trypanosoma brucei brucei TREU927]RHW70044.1 hypothetical protein DPX39_090070200 [Trypanosoma brucei equiperdum]